MFVLVTSCLCSLCTFAANQSTNNVHVYTQNQPQPASVSLQSRNLSRTASSPILRSMWLNDLPAKFSSYIGPAKHNRSSSVSIPPRQEATRTTPNWKRSLSSSLKRSFGHVRSLSQSSIFSSNNSSPNDKKQPPLLPNPSLTRANTVDLSTPHRPRNNFDANRFSKVSPLSDSAIDLFSAACVPIIPQRCSSFEHHKKFLQVGRKIEVNNIKKSKLKEIQGWIRDSWDVIHRQTPNLETEDDARSFRSSDSASTLNTKSEDTRCPDSPLQEMTPSRPLVSRISTTTSDVSSGHTFAESDNQRQNILFEILSTERSYVSSLSTLSTLYIRPLASYKILSTRHVALIFSNISTLLNIHTELLKDLEAAFQKGFASAAPLGSIFLKYVRLWKLYTIYCNSFACGMEIISQLSNDSDGSRYSQHHNLPKSFFPPIPRQTKRKWKNFSKFASLDPRHHRKELMDFLVLPVQRLTRYRLLLQSLIKKTDCSHADYDSLVEALGQVNARIEECNQARRRDSIFDFESSLSGMILLGGVDSHWRGEDLIRNKRPGRHLVCQADWEIHCICSKSLASPVPYLAEKGTSLQLGPTQYSTSRGRLLVFSDILCWCFSTDPTTPKSRTLIKVWDLFDNSLSLSLITPNGRSQLQWPPSPSQKKTTIPHQSNPKHFVRIAAAESVVYFGGTKTDCESLFHTINLCRCD